MKARCVILVDSSQYSAYAGNVQSVQIMIFAAYAIMATNIRYGIDSPELLLPTVAGNAFRILLTAFSPFLTTRLT